MPREAYAPGLMLGDASLVCPHCQAELVPGGVPDVALWCCARCGGAWTDTKGSWLVARALLSAEARAAATLTRQRAKQRDAYRANARGASTRRCPSCGSALERGHAAGRGVEVDLCRAHGTWFDAGEIERIVSASEADRSGVDTSAATDDPRDFQRLSDKIVVALFSGFARRYDDDWGF